MLLSKGKNPRRRGAEFFLIILLLFGLLISSAFAFCEDFTLFYEQDGIGSDNITIHNSTFIEVDFVRNQEDYVNRSYGSGYFKTSWTHKFRVQVNQSSSNNAYGGVWALSNVTDDIKGWEDNNNPYFLMFFYDFDVNGSGKIYLREYDGAVRDDQIYNSGAFGIWYYITIVRSGSAFYSEIRVRSYTGPLQSNLSLTLDKQYHFEYLFPVNSWNAGQAGHSMITFIQDLHFADWPILTYYFQDGGQFRINCTQLSNGTIIEYKFPENLTWMALPRNSSYLFSRFNWTGGLTGYNDTNPYTYNLNQSNVNLTIWLDYDIPSGAADTFTYVALGVFGFIMAVVALIVRMIWPNKEDLLIK